MGYCLLTCSLVVVSFVSAMPDNINDPIIKYLIDSADAIKNEVAAPEESACAVCEEKYCPTSEDACPYGLLPDQCGCCKLGVCKLVEGDKCLDIKHSPKLSETDLTVYGLCGLEMTCLMRNDLRPMDQPESLCTCNDIREVCGSNNVTYESVCALSKAAEEVKAMEHILIDTWGPCQTEPVITSPPQDVQRPLESEVGLDCEAQGFPIPSITWEFQAANGQKKILPSDDPTVAVLFRGGPEKYMTTSWVQISALRKQDAGSYICIAKNSAGETKTLARVNIEP